jgi:hypothetical protein
LEEVAEGVVAVAEGHLVEVEVAGCFRNVFSMST